MEVTLRELLPYLRALVVTRDHERTAPVHIVQEIEIVLEERCADRTSGGWARDFVASVLDVVQMVEDLADAR